jgi:hypothetical protein
MREHGYEQVWKSINPEIRRQFKFARATVERFGKDLPKKITDLEARAQRLRRDQLLYLDTVKQLDALKAMMTGWGKDKKA